jgi:hypothetical protein
LHIAPEAHDAGRLDSIAWQALRLTLDDLVQGRLALGADSSSGLGYLQGRYDSQLFDDAICRREKVCT